MSLTEKHKKFIFIIYLIILLFNLTNGYFSTNDDPENKRDCFCELSGSIDDCTCNVDTVDHYNNVKIYPRLKSLLVKDYFRFYKVNLRNECPFWADDSRCAMKFCHVKACNEEDLPIGLKGSSMESANNLEKPSFKYSKEGQQQQNDCVEDLNEELGYLNKSISAKAVKGFQLWADYDDALDNFCILDDHQIDAEYVDLLLNPERYTGYRGESAHKIWRSIYLENCFVSHKAKPSLSAFIQYTDMTSTNGICMEQRAFYRLVSGLHASINIHLCANYLLSEKKDFVSTTGIWGSNVDEFKNRFSPETTYKEGPHWLRNLYFAYIVELRALAKAAPYLRDEKYFTGIDSEDIEVQLAVQDLLKIIEKFPSHFNESQMFTGGAASLKLKNEFKEKFRNISKIMDCVGCDKCRLWGKLQIQGLGTALKILFSGKFGHDVDIKSDANSKEHPDSFKLRRSEIVALFNAFGRLSTSIHSLENFRKVLR